MLGTLVQPGCIVDLIRLATRRERCRKDTLRDHWKVQQIRVNELESSDVKGAYPAGASVVTKVTCHYAELPA